VPHFWASLYIRWSRAFRLERSSRRETEKSFPVCIRRPTSWTKHTLTGQRKTESGVYAKRRLQVFFIGNGVLFHKNANNALCGVVILTTMKKRGFCRRCALMMLAVMLFLCSLPLSIKSNQTNYFIMRLKVYQRAGQLSLPHVGMIKTGKIDYNVKPMSK